MIGKRRGKRGHVGFLIKVDVLPVAKECFSHVSLAVEYLVVKQHGTGYAVIGTLVR